MVVVVSGAYQRKFMDQPFETKYEEFASSCDRVM